ncbi:MAG: oligosaccharide flippase family protein [Microgenomates group bacterium]
MEKLKKNTLTSAFSLFFQSGYSAFLGFIANLVLTILLSPKIFGIYFTVLSIIAILNYFSDIGLAASLIQKKDINDKEIATVFTIQQILTLTIITIGFFLTAPIIRFYKLPLEGQYLYWALLFSFFLSSLKTIPSILLERQILFQKIVFVQVIENTFFYLTVIILAILNFGLNSFTYAVILRALIGVILIYKISPWKIKITIDFLSLKKLLSFGVPFQISSFLALLKDDLMTLYLGKTLGFTTLGYLGWAKKWAEAVLRIIMDSLSRVLFPVFSRVQDDKEKLKSLVEKIIYFQSMIIIPVILGMMLVMEKIIFLIPRYSKWQIALPYFYLFSISALLSSYSTPFINLLNGLGKVKISFYFMIFWTAGTWILTPILIKLFGAIGFPITLIILSSSFIFVLATTKKFVDFSFIKNFYPFLISSLIFFISQKFLPFKDNNFLNLSLLILSSIIIYLASLTLIFRINIFEKIKKLWMN